MRTLSFDVDVSHARKVNENYAELRRLRISSLIVGAAVAIGGILMVVFSSGGWMALGALLILLGMAAGSMYLYLPRKVGTIEDQYLDSELVGAVVASTRRTGYTLVGLVNVSRKPDAEPIYAIVARGVSLTAGKAPAVGAKVPCAAVLADRNSRPEEPHWQSASLMPISWGTTDAKVIARATSMITGPEWDLIGRFRDQADEIRTSREQMRILARQELPHALRGDTE